jgi:hypothetical protein
LRLVGAISNSLEAFAPGQAPKGSLVIRMRHDSTLLHSSTVCGLGVSSMNHEDGQMLSILRLATRPKDPLLLLIPRGAASGMPPVESWDEVMAI